MPENKKLVINISTVTILKVFFILLILVLAYYIREIILLLLVSLVLAAVIEPSVDLAAKKKIPRSLATILIYIFLFLFIAMVVMLLVPPVTEQFTLLINSLPNLLDKLVENFGIINQYSAERGLTDNIRQGLLGLQSGIEQAAGGIYSFLISFFWNLVNLVVILALTFYLVVEKDSLNNFVKIVTPKKHHQNLINLIKIIKTRIGDWAVGQLTVGLIVGVIVAVGLFLLLPKYALILALIAGLAEFVPYIGPVLAAVPAIFLGLTVPPFSLGRGLAILIFYIVIQQIESNFIAPQIMKRHTGINPVLIIMAMLIGAQLAGVIGLILAIPITTSIIAVINDLNSKSNPIGKDNLDDK
ncbi:MAG: AI-2E family transporter [Patescibacteria group bacterium]